MEVSHKTEKICLGNMIEARVFTRKGKPKPGGTAREKKKGILVKQTG